MEGFDRWVLRFASDEYRPAEFDGFCKEFARYFLGDQLFVELSRSPWLFVDPKVDSIVIQKVEEQWPPGLRDLLV